MKEKGLTHLGWDSRLNYKDIIKLKNKSNEIGALIEELLENYGLNWMD